MDDRRIVLAHGGGGALTRELVEGLIIPAINGINGDRPLLLERASELVDQHAAPIMGVCPHLSLPDAAPVPQADEFAFTTDGFVVKPLFFRGGDIGSLSVHGTVNDLAVSGAEPLALSMALILEEGLDLDVLRRVVESASSAARACGVRIITGDTKVVARGEADQLFVTTAGIGRRRLRMAPGGLREGDFVLINGPIAEHGIAVMSEREGIGFDTQVQSDSAPVWPFVQALIERGVDVHAMRDPTRGGLAACCVELANDSGVTVALDEAAIPVRRAVRGACELLGLDPLTVANEGKVVAFLPEPDAQKALDIFRSTPGGEHAAIIGTVIARKAVPACLRTRFGGERIVEMPYGEDLPRIC